MGYYGESMDTDINEDHPAALKSFLTLNAVDGSVIDRGQVIENIFVQTDHAIPLSYSGLLYAKVFD